MQIVVQSLLSDPSGETVAIVHASVGSGMFLALLVVVFRERSLRAFAPVAATCWPVVPLGPGVRARRRWSPPAARRRRSGSRSLSIVVYLAIGALTWPSVGRQAFRLLLARR